MGKLNISHHKSWHVYNQKNRDRVKRDELAAEKEKQEQESRVQKAEQESRLEQLRARTGASNRDKSLDHVNLFPQESMTLGNTEYMQEESQKKMKAEAPFTMYLSQSTKDALPWYVSSKNAPAPSASKGHKSKEYKEALLKESLDPMKALIHSPTKGTSRSTTSSTASTSIENLRQQRLEREAKERARQQQVLNPTVHLKEPSMYHSQYNPEATSTSKSKTTDNRYNPYKYMS